MSMDYTDGLVQDCDDSFADTLELSQFSTKQGMQ